MRQKACQASGHSSLSVAATLHCCPGSTRWCRFPRPLNQEQGLTMRAHQACLVLPYVFIYFFLSGWLARKSWAARCGLTFQSSCLHLLEAGVTGMHRSLCLAGGGGDCWDNISWELLCEVIPSKEAINVNGVFGGGSRAPFRLWFCGSVNPCIDF